MTITNRQLAELAARASDEHEGNKQKTLRRCSRVALMWEEEAAEVVAQGRSPTELEAVGQWLERVLREWIEDPPPVPEPPLVRADFMTYAHAREALNGDPPWREALGGDLQMHTLYSDGKGSVIDMAITGCERGYDFIAITDHSKGLKIAGGMEEGELARQGGEIERVNEALTARGERLRVLRALEMNIDPAGKGDMEDDALRTLDLIIGSFHSKLRSTEDQTDRYLAALRNPHVHVLGHPRGRMYSFRPGLNADWGRVMETAAEFDKAVEIDGYPYRQDLNVELLSLAREARVRISIGTDAHNQAEMRFIDVGLAAALEAGLPKERILNFQPWERIVEWTTSLASH